MTTSIIVIMLRRRNGVWALIVDAFIAGIQLWLLAEENQR
jgi:hypothetical protein